MKVLLFLAKGFEHMESSVFIDVMGWARYTFHYDVQVDTCGFEKQVNSTFDVPVVVDKLIDDIDVSQYDALALPGGFAGFGFYDEVYCSAFLDLLRQFDQQGKYIASVCVGSMPLGKSGVLKGRKGTTYHLEGGKWQRQLAEFGVDVVKEPVVVDGNIITSYCPETAPKVAFMLLERLTSTEKMEVVRESMGY